MAVAQTWCDIPETAKIMKITEAEVRQKICNGDFIFQDGVVPKISFSNDPKRTPQYIYISPGCTAEQPMPSTRH